MIMQLAVEHDLVVHQIDVKNTYLEAPMDCVVYIDQPEGFKKIGNGDNKSVFLAFMSCLLKCIFISNNFNQSAYAVFPIK